MNIENFFPKFPNIFNYQSAILNPYDNDFNDAIVTKKEFETLKLKKYEELTAKDDLKLNKYEKLRRGTVGDLSSSEKKDFKMLNHQKIISRFFSSLTPYDQLLLFHEMEAITHFIKRRICFIK